MSALFVDRLGFYGYGDPGYPGFTDPPTTAQFHRGFASTPYGYGACLGYDYMKGIGATNILNDPAVTWIPPELQGANWATMHVGLTLWVDAWINAQNGRNYAANWRTALTNMMAVQDSWGNLYSEAAVSYVVPEGQSSSGSRGTIPGATAAQRADVAAARTANPGKKILMECNFLNTNEVFSPQRYANIHAFIDSQVFDGYTLYLKGLTADVADPATAWSYYLFSSKQISYQQFVDALAPMAAFAPYANKYFLINTNMAVYQYDQPVLGIQKLSWYDTASQEMIAEKLSNCMLACKAIGLKSGVYYDSEENGTGWCIYSSQAESATKSRAEMQTQTFNVAKQWGAAIYSAMPDAVVIPSTTLGATPFSSNCDFIGPVGAGFFAAALSANTPVPILMPDYFSPSVFGVPARSR